MYSFDQPQPEFTTPRLKLLALSNSEIDAFLPIAMKEGLMIESREEALKILKNVEAGFKERRTLTWGMYKDNVLIGSCGFYRGFRNKTGEVGYIMHSDYRKQGLMFEALKTVIDFGFTEMDLNKITAYTKVANNASVNLLLKLNFVQTEETHNEFTIFCLDRANNKN